MLLTLPILQEMRKVEGWLDEDEADLFDSGRGARGGFLS